MQSVNTRMLGAADEEHIQQVRQVVQRYAPDAVEDIESMVVLGKLEYERAQRPGRSPGAEGRRPGDVI